MVQEFMILRCFSCTTFQVHQVKKRKKWACKVCGEKQSVKKVYAQGSGQDCRKHVQKLNMKCGEAQRAEHLAFDSEESPDFCEFSENSHSAVKIEDSTNHVQQSTDQDDENLIGLPKGASKWEKFLEINSSNDNGSDDSFGFNVTTERDVFDKASSRGKRKSTWHRGKSNTYHRGKRYKNSAKEEDQVNASDMDRHDVKSVSHKTLSHANQNHFLQMINPRMHNPSPKTLVCYDMTSMEHHNKYQSYCNSIPPCGDLQSNDPQTSHNKCNIYFAKATRDHSTPKIMPPSVTGDKGKPPASSSKWAKFMPSSSTQNNSHETTIEDNSLPYFYTSDNKYNDNSRCDPQTILPFQQGSKKQDILCNSLLVEDLFKVDDDLDGEWWNSL